MSPSGSLHAIIAATLAQDRLRVCRATEAGLGIRGGRRFGIGLIRTRFALRTWPWSSAEADAGHDPGRLFPGPPDLAVEVLSPH